MSLIRTGETTIAAPQTSYHETDWLISLTANTHICCDPAWFTHSQLWTGTIDTTPSAMIPDKFYTGVTAVGSVTLVLAPNNPTTKSKGKKKSKSKTNTNNKPTSTNETTTLHLNPVLLVPGARFNVLSASALGAWLEPTSSGSQTAKLLNTSGELGIVDFATSNPRLRLAGMDPAHTLLDQSDVYLTMMLLTPFQQVRLWEVLRGWEGSEGMKNVLEGEMKNEKETGLEKSVVNKRRDTQSQRGMTELQHHDSVVSSASGHVFFRSARITLETLAAADTFLADPSAGAIEFGDEVCELVRCSAGDWEFVGRFLGEMKRRRRVELEG